jgi:hypothetical protein
MEINLSSEMVSTIYKCLLAMPADELLRISSGDEDYEVTGIDALDLFEDLIRRIP